MMQQRRQLGDFTLPGVPQSLETAAKLASWTSTHSNEIVAVVAFALLTALFIPSSRR